MATLAELIVKIGADVGAFDQGLKGINRKVAKFGKDMKAVGGTLTAGVTLPIIAIGAAIGKAATEFQDFDQAIAAGTGAIGETLDGLKESARNVFAALPESTETVSGVITNLNTDLGLTGTALEDLAVQVANASRLLGEDAVSNSRALGQALNQFGLDASSAGEQMDFLFSSSQQYGTSIGGLLTATRDYGSVLKNAGFTMEESVDLFGRLDQAGLSVSRLMPGLNRAFRDMAAAGEEPRAALGGLVEAIKSAKTPMEALDLATKVFGAEGAQRLVAAIQEGSFELEGLGGGLTTVSGLVNKAAAENATFTEALTKLGNQVKLLFEPLGVKLVEALQKVTDLISPLVTKFSKLAKEFIEANPKAAEFALIFGGFAALIGPVTLAIGFLVSGIALVSAPLLAWGAAIVVVGGILIAFRDDIADFIKNLGIDWEGLWEGVTETTSKAIDAIKQIVDEGMKLIKAIFDNPAVKLAAKLLWDGVKTVFTAAWDALKGVVSGALNIIKGIFTAWRGIFEGDWSLFTTGLLGAWDGLWEAIKATLLNVGKLVISAAQGVADGVKGAFSSLKSLLVDNSIVPEMMDSIQAQFGRLGGEAMFTPTTDAISAVEGEFGSLDLALAGAASGAVPGLIGSVQTEFAKLGDTAMVGPVDLATGEVETSFGALSTDLVGSGGVVTTLISDIGKVFDSMAGDLAAVFSGEGSIKDLAVNAFNGIGDAVLNIASEEVLGFLMGKLDDLIAKFTGSGGVADAFSSAFGGIGGGGGGGGGGGIPGIPGGGGGGGGGGGAMSLVDLGLKLFDLTQQKRQISTLGLIEENTRALNFRQGTGGVLGTLFLIKTELMFGTFVKVLEESRDHIRDHLGPIKDWVALTANEVTWGFNTKANERSRDILNDTLFAIRDGVQGTQTAVEDTAELISAAPAGTEETPIPGRARRPGEPSSTPIPGRARRFVETEAAEAAEEEAARVRRRQAKDEASRATPRVARGRRAGPTELELPAEVVTAVENIPAAVTDGFTAALDNQRPNLQLAALAFKLDSLQGVIANTLRVDLLTKMTEGILNNREGQTFIGARVDAQITAQLQTRDAIVAAIDRLPPPQVDVSVELDGAAIEATVSRRIAARARVA